jgi:3',5'-cyclic AMP phosphodiesterase CpdA
MSNRRSFLKNASLGLFGLGSFQASSRSFDKQDEVKFRIAHVTDQHVTSRRKGHLGYQKCVDSINALRPSPDFVLMGGDMVFDGLYTELDVYQESIELYKKISDTLEMPYYHCIGNHDVLGLSSRRKVAQDHPEIGRAYIMNRLGMSRDYYSFNHKGWHFVVLNSILEKEGSSGPAYEARIGEQQMEWLRFDLGKHKDMPTIAVSHLAAFSHKGQIRQDFDMKAMSGIILQDNKQLREVLERHSVRALLQGHTHVSENFQYNKVWYITSQSASAAWWGGNWLGFKPGYTILELGERDIIKWYANEYEWQHQLEAEDTIERERILEQKEFEAEQQRLYIQETTSE